MLGQIGTVLTLLPRIIGAVALVEDFISPDTPGPEKKEMALDWLRESGVPEFVLSIAGPLIDLVVTVLNKTGVFHKPGVEPTVTVERLSAPAAAMRRARESEDVVVTDDAFAKFLDSTARPDTPKR